MSIQTYNVAYVEHLIVSRANLAQALREISGHNFSEAENSWALELTRIAGNVLQDEEL